MKEDEARQRVGKGFKPVLYFCRCGLFEKLQREWSGLGR